MLIKSFGRHFAVRVLIIAAIQVGFIVAKLTVLLTWHWLLVFAPLIITYTVLLIFLFMAGVIAILSNDSS